MSKLRRASYTPDLKGKTITRCEWTNDATEHYYSLCIFFTDNTMVSFRFYLSVEEEVELQDFVDGNISSERLLEPTPIQTKKENE